MLHRSTKLCCELANLFLRPRQRWRSIVMSTSVCVRVCVCLSVCLSVCLCVFVRQHFSRSTCAIFVYVAYGRGSVLFRRRCKISSAISRSLINRPIWNKTRPNTEPWVTPLYTYVHASGVRSFKTYSLPSFSEPRLDPATQNLAQLRILTHCTYLRTKFWILTSTWRAAAILEIENHQILATVRPIV